MYLVKFSVIMHLEGSDNVIDNVGAKIKMLRMEKGISQTKLAEMSGETKQTIYKYETGIIKNIPLPKLEIIASILGCDPSFLTGWEKEKPTEEEVGELSEEERKMLELFRMLSPERRKTVLSLVTDIVTALQ